MISTVNMKKFLKIVHQIAAAGLLGALSAYLVLVLKAPGETPTEFAAIRHGIQLVSKWIVMPSLLLVLVSGLLSMAVHRPFMNAGWVWLKAVLGISMFEGTLLAVQSNAERGARLASRALEGAGDPAQLADLLRHERAGLWTIVLLSIANVVIGVWRPRLARRRAAPPQSRSG
jgi:uncharacterized membrane protein